MTHLTDPIVRPAVRAACRPIALAVGAALLQACAAPPQQIAKKELAMEPLLRVGHSPGQTARTYYQLGKYHQQRGNHELAVEAFKHSLALDSQQLEARNALAAVYSLNGKLVEAKSLLLDLVAEYPGVAHPHNNLGYIYFIEGNYSAAVQTLKRALMLDFGNERARNNLSVAELALAKNGTDNLTTLQVAASVDTVNAVNSAETRNQIMPDLISQDQPDGDLKATVMSASGVVSADISREANKISPPDQPANKTLGLIPQIRMELVRLAANVLELRFKPGMGNKPDNVFSTSQELIAKKGVTKALGNSVEPIAKTVAALDATPTASASGPAYVLVARSARIEVANGNGVEGMAKRFGHFLGKSGINVAYLANERPYVQQETKIQYRAGYEQTANMVKQALRGRAILVPATTMAAKTDVRLVIGKEAVLQLARLEEEPGDSLVTVHAGAEKERGKVAVSSL
jgi:Tfp pilus assembly protein PilF